MWRRLTLVIAAAGLVGLAGCPDNQYDYSTWTKKLNDPRDSERAVTELEQLGNPKAIPALGQAWLDQGKPVRLLQVMITLARPLTPAEAKEKFVTDYEKSGRKASWDAALPYLQKALTEVDEANPRSVDSATKAADALGESKLAGGLDALVDIVSKPVTKRLIQAQVASIRAIGKYDSEKPAAAGALTKIIDREPPPHPRTATKETKASIEEKFSLFLAVTGAAINALSDLRSPSAARTLVFAQYRTPELFTQIRRALVASGPTAKDELLKILADKSPEVDQLIKDKRLNRYCGEKGDAPADQCLDVSAKYFYPTVVIGDFYDPATVPALLRVLDQKPQPAYYIDEVAGPTQHNAVFDALGKIGGAGASARVHDMWKGVQAPKRGEMAPAEFNSKLLAITKYPFVTTDGAGVEDLARIAADNGADREAQFHDELRRVAAEAFARMSRDPNDIKVLEQLAAKYFEAADKKAKEAAAKKPEADAADKELERQKKALDDVKVALIRTTKDKDKSAADIKAATESAKKAEAAFKEYKKKHRDQIRPYKDLEQFAKAYKQFARLFQTHIARIEVALRCKNDLDCYAGTLKQTPEQAATFAGKYIKDIKSWSKEEQVLLLEGNVERAMLELGKQGTKASKYTELLLDSAKSDNRIIRQSILLALPKIAAVPCATCEAKLDIAIKAGEGKTGLGDLNLETTMMRNYFSWAGGKSPVSATSSGAPAEKPPAEK